MQHLLSNIEQALAEQDAQWAHLCAAPEWVAPASLKGDPEAWFAALSALADLSAPTPKTFPFGIRA